MDYFSYLWYVQISLSHVAGQKKRKEKKENKQKKTGLSVIEHRT